MARIPMVTRTFTSTIVTFMAVDTVAGETHTELVTLPRTYKDKETILKKVKESYDTETLKAVAVLDTVEEEHLYGMSEHDFITYANIIEK